MLKSFLTKNPVKVFGVNKTANMRLSSLFRMQMRTFSYFGNNPPSDELVNHFKDLGISNKRIVHNPT
jgi:hypothetical protein